MANQQQIEFALVWSRPCFAVSISLIYVYRWEIKFNPKFSDLQICTHFRARQQNIRLKMTNICPPIDMKE